MYYIYIIKFTPLLLFHLLFLLLVPFFQPVHSCSHVFCGFWWPTEFNLDCLQEHGQDYLLEFRQFTNG